MKNFLPKADQSQAEKIKICPVCAAVSFTWLLISAGVVTGLLDYENWKLAIAIAMGGTAVGISHQLEKKFGWQNPIVKLLVITAGFILAYLAIININTLILAVETVIMLVLGYLFFISRIDNKVGAGDPEKIKELEEKMKNCC